MGVKRQAGRLRNRDRFCMIVGDGGEILCPRCRKVPSVLRMILDGIGRLNFKMVAEAIWATSKMTASGHATLELGTASCYVAVLGSLLRISGLKVSFPLLVSTITRDHERHLYL